jgi:hypothetical protein
MTYQLINVSHTPSGENTQTPSSMEQVLEILSGVFPHMTTESQASFISMFHNKTSNLPSHPPHTKLSSLSDPLYDYLRDKMYVCVSNIHTGLTALQYSALIRI